MVSFITKNRRNYENKNLFLIPDRRRIFYLDFANDVNYGKYANPLGSKRTIYNELPL